MRSHVTCHNIASPVESSSGEVGVREQARAADVQPLEDLVELLWLELLRSAQDCFEVLDRDLSAPCDVRLLI